MELQQTIEERRSIRSFTDEEVKTGHLKEMVRRAGLAPSVNNYQPWKFIVVKNKNLLHQMAKVVSKKIHDLPQNRSKVSDHVKSQVEWFSTFFENAPALIALTMEGYETVLEKGVTLSHDEINRERNYPDMQSAGACIQNILLSAVDLGYGACWLSGPMVAGKELESILNIKKPFQLIAFVAVGKAKNAPSPKKKNPLDEIFKLLE